MVKFLVLPLLIVLCQLLQLDATISDNFQAYVKKEFGEDGLKLVSRRDFGSAGSFGGGEHQAGTKTGKTPVVFVHGVSSSARSTAPIAWAFKAYGYKDEELYGTTYGQAMGLMPFQPSVKCEYIKGVRTLIKAVIGYTNQTVNVVGYSLGGPISRKAILGGKCLDTGEDLGPPLTESINAYLGVAGAQQGCNLCNMVISDICSKKTGIGCDSDFYHDINGQKGYEGKKVYVLQSLTDEIVGHIACGKKASEVPGAHKIVTLTGYLHLQMCSALTAKHQYELLNTKE